MRLLVLWNLDFSLTGFCNCAKNPDDAKGTVINFKGVLWKSE
jgi:hypothetical protein